jgi:hypothetical protein
MTVDGLLSKLGGKLEEINFLEIQSYLRKSKAWRRIHSSLEGTLTDDYSLQGKSQRTLRRRKQRPRKEVGMNKQRTSTSPN